MQTSWVVIANAAGARLYQRETVQNLVLLETLEHDQSREKGSQLASDRPGHFQGKGNGRGAFVEETSPKEYEAQRFAQELADILDKARNEHKYSSLIIASSPHFHGLLNKKLNKHVSEMVKKHIEKDLSHVPEHELSEQLKLYL